MIYQIICEECDSEYQVHTESGLYQDDPQFCAICGESNSPELLDEDEI